MAKNRFHNIVDLENCTKKIDKKIIKDFIAEVVPKIKMRILHGPVIVEESKNNSGLSGFAIISFSHISIHTFNDYNEILIDIFSCKEYDKKVVLDLCKKYFSTQNTKITEKQVWWGKAK